MSDSTENQETQPVGMRLSSLTRAEHRRHLIYNQQKIRLEDILKRLSYKPEVEAQLASYDDPSYTTLVIHFRYSCKDVNNPTGEKTHVGKPARFNISDLSKSSDKEIALLIANEIKELESHEFKEWLFFDNEHLIEPHPETSFPYGASTIRRPSITIPLDQRSAPYKIRHGGDYNGRRDRYPIPTRNYRPYDNLMSVAYDDEVEMMSRSDQDKLDEILKMANEAHKIVMEKDKWQK